MTAISKKRSPAKVVSFAAKVKKKDAMHLSSPSSDLYLSLYDGNDENVCSFIITIFTVQNICLQTFVFILNTEIYINKHIFCTVFQSSWFILQIQIFSVFQ